MPRTLPELLQAMKKIAKGTPQAKALIHRFAQRVIPRSWDPEVEFEADHGFIIESVGRKKKAVVAIFLPEGIEPPEDDAIVWTREAFVGRVGGPRVHTLFVDAVPRHEDWVALKALFEIGLIETSELANELRDVLQPQLRVSERLLGHYLRPSVSRARCAHEQMMTRIMDRRLGGRIGDRIRAIKREHRNAKLIPELLGRRLVSDILELIPLAWPASYSADEREARDELVRSAASMIVFDVIEPPADIN